MQATGRLRAIPFYLPFKRPWLCLAVAFCLTVLAGPLPAAAQAPRDLWKFDYVDMSRSFSDMTGRSLALDASGQPHIAYGQDHLYYSWRDDDGWHHQVVDTTYHAGGSASLALDTDGYAHITYVVTTASWSVLKYARQDAAGWHLMWLAGTDLGEVSTLALDAAGYPHVAYATEGTGNLRHIYRDSTGWHTDVVPLATYIDDPFSLALDANGLPHLSFQRFTDYALAHGYKDAAGWHIETVADPGYSNVYNSIAVDASGYAHIAYRDDNTGALYYAYQDTSGWHTEMVDDTGGTHPSLVLDADGRPHVSFYGFWQLRYAYRDETGWHAEQVGGEARGYYISLALDAAGGPHLSFVGGSNQDQLTYAYHDETGWHTELVFQGGGDVGLHPWLALDAAGEPHLSYQGANSLRYAYHDAGSQTWHVEIVDPDFGSGWYSSLSIDAEGQVHIAYRGAGVEYASRDTTGWHTETVDAGASPSTLSLRHDAAGQPHLAYMDWNDHNLKYATRDGSGWHVEMVPTGSSGYVSYDVSMALDANAYPHITFVEEISNNELKYVYQDGSGWHVETVDATAGAGANNSLALDAAGQPHVAYYYYYYLRYASRDDSGWHWETVGGGGGGNSLAFDAAGYPHISHNDSAERLLYTFQDTAGWHTVVVEDRQGAARGTSLVLNGDGRPRIGYFAYYEADLKYAYAVPGHAAWLPHVTRSGAR